MRHAPRIVVAIGGGAPLLRRGREPGATTDRGGARAAARSLAPLALENELVLVHRRASDGTLLGAQLEGLIGHVLQQELVRLLPADLRVATLLGTFDHETIEAMLETNAVVACVGETTGTPGDPYLATAHLAADLRADTLLITTRRDAVYAGEPKRAIRRATPTALASAHDEASAAVVRAACAFVAQTSGTAVIGAIGDAEALVRHETGTTVTLGARGLELVQ